MQMCCTANLKIILQLGPVARLQGISFGEQTIYNNGDTREPFHYEDI